MTVNAEEMIDLRDIVHRKSIHTGLDCITDGPIGGRSSAFAWLFIPTIFKVS